MTRVATLCIIFLFVFVTPTVAASEHDSILGDWDCEVYVDGQIYPVTFSLNETDGTLSGSATSDMGTTELEAPKYSEGKLTFKIYIAEAGTIDFDLTISGREMKGTLGNYDFQGTVTGTKK